MKKFLFLTLLFLVFISSNKVKAYCDDTEIIRLQNLTKNVTSSYVYNKSNDTFTVTFTNMKKDLVLINIDDMSSYNVDGELNFNNLLSGNHNFVIYARDKECISDELSTRYIKLPYKNPYFNSEICEGIESYSYCNQWLDNSISYDVWTKKINEHKKQIENKSENTKNQTTTLLEMFKKIYKKSKQIYLKYYFIILPAIIIILGAYIVIKNRKNSLV